MKRIGIAIPGWPAYTIDDKEVVRSYMNVYAMQGEGKIIKGSNRCHHLHRLGEDGKIEDLWCSKRKLLASAKLGIDPANVNLRDLVVNDNGEWVNRRDFARQMGVKGATKAKCMRAENKQEQVERIHQQIRLLQAQEHYILTGDMVVLVKELEDMKEKVFAYIRMSRISKYWDKDIYEDLFSNLRDKFLESVQGGEYYSNPFYLFVYRLQQMMRDIRRRNAAHISFNDNIMVKNYGKLR